MLRRVLLSSKKLGISTLGPNWEGHYCVTEELRPATFKIETLDEKLQPHPRNVEHLRMCYQ